MTYRKNGLKLGLSLMAVLGLMAFAASAQAETGGLWLYLLTVGGVTHDVPVGTSIDADLDGGDALLHSTVGGSSVLILCKTLTIADGLVGAAGTGTGTLNLTNCETLINGVVNANCKPAEPISSSVKTLPVLHNSKTYMVFEPTAAEEKFVTISLGASCVVGNKFVIKGKVPVKECGTNTLETHLVEHLVEEAQSLFAGQTEGTKLPVYELKFGVNKASLLGSVKLRSGTGLEWGLVS